MNESAGKSLLELRNEEERAYSSGDWQALSAALEKQAGLMQDPTERAGALYRAACAAERAGDPDRAVGLLKRVTDAPVWESSALLHRIELHWRQGEWEALVEALDGLLAKAAAWDELALRLEKARLLAFRRGLVEDAVSELNLVLEKNPVNREALWLKLVLALRSGSWEEAAAELKRLHELSKEDHDMAFTQSSAYRLAQISEFRFKNAQEAAAYYQSIQEAPLLSLIPLLEQAETSSDWSAATERMKAIAAALEPEGGPPVSLGLAMARMCKDLAQDPEAADSQLNDLLDREPQDFSLLYNAALSAMESGPAKRRAELDQRVAEALTEAGEAAFFIKDRVLVLLHDLGDADKAAEASRRLIEIAPADPAGRHYLVESLIKGERWEEAVAELGAMEQAEKDPRQRQGLLFRMAELASHKLGDYSISLEAYRKALDIPPSQLPILLNIARLYDATGDYQNMVRAILAAAKLVEDPALSGFYRSWLAALYLEKLGGDDQAFAIWAETLKSNPSDYQATRNVARISARKKSYQNLAGALARLAATVTDENLVSELKTSLAWLYETGLNDLEKALTTYRETASSGNAFALESLRRIYYKTSQLGPYADIVQALAQGTEKASLRAARLARLAAVREIQGELSEAWAAYEKARVSLADSPHLFLPMIDLSQLSGYWTRYTGLLDEFAARVGERNQRALLWESAWSRAELPGKDGKIDPAAMLAGFLKLEQDTGESQAALRGAWLASLWSADSRTEADLLARMIKNAPDELTPSLLLRLGYVLRDKVGAGEESIAALRQVLSKEQKSAPLLRELQLMYASAEQWGELIRMLLLEAGLRTEPEVQVDLYSRLAKLYEEKFKAVQESIKCCRTVLKIDKQNMSAHAELTRLLEAQAQWEDLYKALLDYEQVTLETPGKVNTLLKAAETADQKLEDPDRAIEQLRRALDLDPADTRTLGRLESIYQREQRWQDLVQVLKEQAAKTEQTAERAALHEKTAKILEERLDNKKEAIDKLVIARDLEPDRRSVLLSLERLFQAENRWEELIDTLERLAEKAEAPEKIEYKKRIGTLWDEKLGSLENSINSWEQVRRIEAGDVPAAEALVSLYQRTENYPLLAERSAELAELVKDDKDRAVELYCSAAGVRDEKLKDPDAALGLLDRAMEISPSSIQPVSLARSIRERREEWPEVINLLLKEERITQETDKKLEILTRTGKIHQERLADEDNAASMYERALELKNDYLPAVVPLSEIYFKRKAWDAAGPLFETRTGALEREPQKTQAEVYYKAGWCKEQAGEADAAIERYQSSSSAAADYRPPLERLSEMYYKRESLSEAEDFTNRLLGLVRAQKDMEAAFVLLLRLGEVEKKLEKPDRAIAAFEEALEIKPGHYETLLSLVELYKSRQEWKKALTTYDSLIGAAPGKEAAAEHLASKGVILEDRMGEEESALAHFRKAVEILPLHLESWDRLSNIYLRRSAWQEAETALLKLIELDQNQQRLVQHHHNLGKVYKEGLSDLAKAREQFEAALKLNEAHIPSMEALGDVYLEQEEWEKFIESSERFVKLIPEEKQESLLPLYFKMGEVYKDHLNNNERAIIQYKQIVKQQPDNEKARSELTSIYVSDPKFTDQAKAESLNLIRLQPYRARTYRDLAKIFQGQGNLDAVFVIYSILNIIDTLNYEEEMFYEANKNKTVSSSKRSIKQVEREGMLIHPDERGALHDMLVAVGDSLQKIFPPPMNRYGVKKSNQLTEKSTSPIKDLAAELAVNLGIEDLNIHLAPQSIEPQVFQTSPPTMAINTDWFNKFNETEKRFIMGRLIEHMINGHGLPIHFPPDQVIRTLCLIAMAADPGVKLKLKGVSEGDMEKEIKAARKLIPRKARNQIEHAAQRFTQETADTDPQTWRKAMDHTANRAGLLVCNDLETAFGAIIKTDPQYKNVKYDQLQDKSSIWEKHPDVVELLAFAVSDPFFRLRERMGFSITG